MLPDFFQGKQAGEMCCTIFQNEETPFQTMKTRSSKSRKIVIFPKGLVHGFGKNLEIFPHFFKKKKQAKQMCFTISQKEETPLQTIKRRSSKSLEIGFFPKGLVHGFGQKLVMLPDSYFRENRPEKCVLRYSRTTKGLSRL